MDLATLTPIERKIEIKHPVTDEPIGVRIGLVSMDDQSMMKLRRQITDRSQKLAQKQKTFSAEELEQNSNDILYTAITGWEWYNPTGNEGDAGYEPTAMPDFNGEVPEFTKRNLIAINKQLAWFKRQISDELEEVKDFFVTSPTS